MDYEEKENLKKKWIIRGIVGLVLFGIVSISWPLGTVGAGERGIRLRFGAVKGVVGEGLYFIIPFVEKVVIMDVKVLKEQVPASAASKDLQNVSVVIALNFHVNPEKADRIYQEVGMLYGEAIIAPALQESIKAVTARFTAEELITSREKVREETKVTLREKLQPRGLVIDDFNIVNFDFSPSFNEAIEAKVTAEQNALAAQNKLEQIKFEAEQAVVAAKGKAEALQIEGRAIAENPQVLQGRAIEKWNGIMPQVTGGSLPFINIPIK